MLAGLLFKGFIGTAFLVVAFFLVCFEAQIVNGQTPTATPEITILESGKPIEREIAGEEKHFYKVSLSANQCAKLVAEQRGVDLTMQLESPMGVLLNTDFDPRKIGSESFEFTTKDANSFTIVVGATQKNAAKGNYQIRIAEIRPATEKDFALDEASRLYSEADRLYEVDKYNEALPLIKRAVEIREKELGTEHPDFANALAMLANQYRDLGDYGTAEPIFLRALAIKEKAFGTDDFSLPEILNSLGNLYYLMVNLPKAEAMYERTLKIREKHLEPNHPSIASIVLNLGNIKWRKGDMVRANLDYQRVLEIREKALGPEHSEVATALNNLGYINLFIEPPDLVKAETYLLRALQIREKNFAPDNPQIGQTLQNLAALHGFTGNSEKSISYNLRALAVFEKSLGPDHPNTSAIVGNLAIVYKNIGDFAKAEPLYQRAIEIKKKRLSEYDFRLGVNYSDLAAIYALKGETEKAISNQTLANQIIEFNIALNLATGSEQLRLQYINQFSVSKDRTLTFSFQYVPESKEAAKLAAIMTLQRKGRVLDAGSDNLNTLRRRFTQADQILLDDLNKINKELAGLVSSISGKLSPEEKNAKIKTLNDEREKLETEISRRADGFFERSKPVTLTDVQRLIPNDVALVEFAVHQPNSLQLVNSYDEKKTPRYVVFVVRSGELKWKDLGETKEIDAHLDAFRQALRDPKRKDVQKLSRAVDEKVMSPIRALVGDAKHLLISPDGELNLIPFEALTDEKGKYLIENYAVSYLSSGRDLLRMQTTRESKSKPLAIGNPLFGEPNGEQIAQTTKNVKLENRRSITTAREMNGVYFAPLAGSESEAKAIQTIFPDATFLSGAQATETAIKALTAPKFLHIATHGFFLEDTSGSSSSSGTKPENPLLRSGLALAGANQRKGTTDDGILTALEASGLNLWGTKLVVLSACDTGLGEIKNGEGVYGLRRSFVLAGTESMVMSLWSVSDYVTRELMTNYYKNLKTGMGRNAALRQVQLQMLKKSGRQHPFYWASFIQSGEWANLEGKR